ncbi:diguanylate cyclase (GGDEF)-like protein/PAS domain S-box-containing protein [Mycetocola sp. CAN_C7]|uniref:sensor domain-containing protein n=1 Tax=Mycetocola sp. CAN_C7 TaxID=2787724 RepID=UPI0018CAF5D2
MTSPVLTTGGPSSADSDAFRTLFEKAPCGYLVTTPDGTVLRVNETFERMTGYSRADLVGSPFAEILTVGSRMFHETRHLPTLQLRGRLSEVALSIQCTDGSTLPTLVNSVLAGEDGEPGELRIAVFDSSERRDYERDLLEARRAAEASAAQLAMLQQASNAFTLADTEEQLTAALAESIREALAASHTAVLLSEDGHLRLAAGVHPLLDIDPSHGSSPETEALRVGRVVTVSNPEDADAAFPGLGALLRTARVETITAAPLIDKGAPAGVVVSFFRRERTFDDAAVELHEMIAAQSAHVLARIRLQDQLTQLALLDQLTGLANRQLLQTRLSQTLAASVRHARTLALIFLDLDGFKAVNDQCGHAVGDSVLQQVADRLRTSVRTADTIARYGGDEFVVICEETDAEAATVIADRIRDAVRQPLESVPAGFPITASVGVALLGRESDAVVTPDGILRLADAAMYQSKNAGKDRVTVVHVDRTTPPPEGPALVQR